MTSPSESLACGTCFFWVHWRTDGDVRLGTCRLHAPVPMAIGVPPRVVTRWPQTTETDWCGDHATPD